MNKNLLASDDKLSNYNATINKIAKDLSINMVDKLEPDKKVWNNLVLLGNQLFKPEKPEGVNEVDLEIKSKLFANIVSEGLGINSIEASDDSLEISGLSNMTLLTQLHSIEPAVKLVGNMLVSDNISEYQINQLKDFSLIQKNYKYVGKAK